MTDGLSQGHTPFFVWRETAMKRTEKLEIKKRSGVYTYTGQIYFSDELKGLEKGWVEIRTLRGEVVRFREDQIEGRQIVEGQDLYMEGEKDL